MTLPNIIRGLPGVRVLGRATVLAALILVSGQAAAAAAATASPPTIVLIGGNKQGYPRTEHDYPDGILAIERLIKGSPQLQAASPVIKAFPAGFPSDLSKIADADVVVVYFGMDYRPPRMTAPLEDLARRAAMERLMAKGAGLIALHQASTVADQTSAAPIADWLGAVRFGMADRSTEIAPVRISAAASPVANGLKDFDYLDEFYPTVTFSKTTQVTPILTAKVHIQVRNNRPVFEEPSADHVIAWAAERPNGGRSFGFTGAHYLATFDQPEIRTMLLNAILWTAKRDVPSGGATTNAVTMRHYGVGRAAPSADTQRVLLPRADALVEPQPWGKLEWFASRALGNSTSMTAGLATISVGKSNPLHRHPNCDEVLHVIQGHIMHRVGDKEYEMQAGDTVTIPEGTLHNARNIGTQDAVLLISFSSPDRISIGE
ncbi:MAG TPA: ThuA domain-containing protein [Steroidobacteraceae bacterium]|nr:ThuA domain-containing protein [Steroidobacteraceae bacterium]